MKIETTRYTCDITGKKCEDMTDNEHSATLSFHLAMDPSSTVHGEFHLSRVAAEEIWMLLSSKYPQLKLEQR